MKKVSFIILFIPFIMFGQTKQDSTVLKYLYTQYNNQQKVIKSLEKYDVVLQYKVQSTKLQQIIDMILKENKRLKAIKAKTKNKKEK